MDPVVLTKPGKVRLELLPPLALYVHIPWCVRKCPYCDFNSHERSGELPERRSEEHTSELQSPISLHDALPISAEKNRISHRGQALARLLELLNGSSRPYQARES